jgi:hypothetical protein
MIETGCSMRKTLAFEMKRASLTENLLARELGQQSSKLRGYYFRCCLVSG